jgi:hypothetical protein
MLDLTKKFVWLIKQNAASVRWGIWQLTPFVENFVVPDGKTIKIIKIIINTIS